MINLKNIFYSFIIFLITILLIKSEFIGNFYLQASFLFTDHSPLVDWLECNSVGVNLYTLEQLICNDRKVPLFNYGHALLIFPWNELLDIFYRVYLPYGVIFIFITLTVKIINPQKKIEIILLFLCLMNPSTLLGFDRLNVDLFVYILAIVICFNRIYFINWFFILFMSFIKIYPAALFVNIFFENPKRLPKHIVLIIASLFLFTMIYFFYFKDYILFFLNNISAGRAGYHFLFSLNSLPKIFKYILNFNYQFLLIIFYSLFIYSVVKFYRIYASFIKEKNDDIFSVDSKLFMIGGFLTLVNFLFFSNWFYREIFLILMMPYFLHKKNDNKLNIYSMIIYILIVRYFFLFIYSYINIHDDIIHIDSIRVFSNKFLLVIFIKSILDFIIMGLISSILFKKSKTYIKKLTLR